jgi:hypothetical protein
MRNGLLSVLVIGTLLTMLSAPPNASAKSGIIISPDTGPEETTVRVEGFGFRPGQEIRIALIGSRHLSTSPRDVNGVILWDETELPATLLLITVTPNENYDFVATVTLPSWAAIREALAPNSNRLEIIAITSSDPDGRFLVARTYFTISGATFRAAEAGVGSDSSFPLWPFWASLGTVAGIASLAFVRRGRMLR